LRGTFHGRGSPHPLARELENLVEGNVVSRISVPAEVAGNARIVLQRMLDI
jgi:quinolinate synthase